jgi:hypothetical protein
MKTMVGLFRPEARMTYTSVPIVDRSRGPVSPSSQFAILTTCCQRREYGENALVFFKKQRFSKALLPAHPLCQMPLFSYSLI